MVRENFVFKGGVVSRLATLVVAATVASTGCGKKNDGPITPQDVQKFDVNWAAGVKLLEAAQAKDLLIGTPPNESTLTYTFDPTAAAVAALQTGDIIVLEGLAYRRVVSVSNSGTSLDLLTERIKLTDAIADGDIAWNQPIAFDSADNLAAAKVYFDQTQLNRTSSGLTGVIEYSGDVGGFAVNVTLTPKSGGVDLFAGASKDIAGETRFAVSANGSLSNFRSSGEILIAGGSTNGFGMSATGLRGDLKVQAAAFNTGASQDLLAIPIGIDMPVQIGPVPLIVKITANVNVTLELSALQSSAEASVDFTYSADQGFTVAGSTMESTGRLSGASFSKFSGGSADAVAAGMAACIEFPRYEIAVAGEFASVGLTQNNCASTVFTFEPPCNKVRGSITGFALGSLGFFGVTLASGQVQLYNREQEITSGAGCTP